MSVLRVGTWTLRRRVLALCVTVGLLLGALGVVAAFTAASSNRQLDDVVNRASPMRAAGERLNTAVVDQETGVRGYAITGRDQNLDPYRSGLAAEQAEMAQIERLLRSGPLEDRIRADLAEVASRSRAWHTAVAEPILDAVRTRGPEAGRALVEAGSTTEFNALREAITAMQTDIGVLRERSAEAAKDASKRMVAIQIAAAAIIVLAGAALMLLLDRMVSRPVTELAEQVRQVAKGDYDKHIESTGSPELSKLADDVDGMRRQIAAELAEVREARQQIEWVNDQLKQQADELTRSNRDLEQFAYVASHDLQEPLRKVASFCQLLQRRYAGQLDERADQYIGFAVDGAQRMQRLINDLLAFSRIGRLTSGFSDVDLNRVLTEVTSQLEARAGDDARIEWADLPTVEGEEPLLTTLFVNLIGNSLKFRRPEVPPVITVSARQDGEEWLLNVRDNGIGIEAEFADKVFVIFQRLHGRDAYEGTGIGLAIVKKIVEYHGGRIWLDLDVTEGTSIWFTLPLLAGVPVQEKAKEVAS
ncbi:histidine kinase [Actinoplanes sp. NBRC 14428]|uniref:histidine kinase n=1 Tax=Pseudosporangium ferrugineum TaxID=439699 RepID=A0A2T0RML8_9ACTN|nr:ATP-binding protein [Pseudosporangium ferrugineum]PRY22377.1 HAMP domain-containing protein [Pseudosporangium ferrugineum]BCJ52472.1 histidine kinase [Actinoplanes sp. NBRC 14428]